MNAAVITLLSLSVLPILWSWVSGYYRHAQFGVVDNKCPRAQNALLKDAGARAVAAQQNAWEALAVFIAAMLALNFSGIDLQSLSHYFWAFIALRFLHGVFYIINQDVLRSFAFLGGYGICIYFFVIAF